MLMYMNIICWNYNYYNVNLISIGVCCVCVFLKEMLLISTNTNKASNSSNRK